MLRIKARKTRVSVRGCPICTIAGCGDAVRGCCLSIRPGPVLDTTPINRCCVFAHLKGVSDWGGLATRFCFWTVLWCIIHNINRFIVGVENRVIPRSPGQFGDRDGNTKKHTNKSQCPTPILNLKPHLRHPSRKHPSLIHHFSSTKILGQSTLLDTFSTYHKLQFLILPCKTPRPFQIHPDRCCGSFFGHLPSHRPAAVLPMPEPDFFR